MVNIFFKDNRILRCKNTVIAFLYDEIINIIHEKQIQLDQHLENLIERFDLAGFGIDFDISKYLKEKNDWELFLAILKECLESYLQKFESLDSETKKNLWDFYRELIKYGDELKEK